MSDDDREGDLAADVAKGLRFTHMMGEQTRQEVLETGLTVLALIEELAGRGAIDPEGLVARTGEVETVELKRIGEHLKVVMGKEVDKYQVGCPDIDCASLMHLCLGRCCTLHFPLTKQDLNERVVKWNYVSPYYIRQRPSDGYCVHSHAETHFCTIYENRPAVCRAYDCRKDKRIWVDFEKKIPTIDPALTPRTTPLPIGEPPV